MKVVFIDTVPNVAKRGEIKVVADGYAQNFLLPQKKAKIATAKVLHELEHEQHAIKRQNEQELQNAQTLAGKIDGEEVVIASTATREGTLYAAIGPVHIAKALRKMGQKISPKHVHCAKPIKSLGSHEARVTFGHGIEAELTIIVEESP